MVEHYDYGTFSNVLKVKAMNKEEKEEYKCSNLALKVVRATDGDRLDAVIEANIAKQLKDVP